MTHWTLALIGFATVFAILAVRCIVVEAWLFAPVAFAGFVYCMAATVLYGLGFIGR